MNAQAKAAPVTGILQRDCACGGACDDCKKKTLQRSPTAHARSDNGAPPIVHDVLRSSGQPLDASTRSWLEPRITRDFSRIPASVSIPQKLAVGEPDDAYERE